MILYLNNKKGFISELKEIPSKLKNSLREKLGEEASDGELISWHNSLSFMKKVLGTPNIPEEAGIALEYNIPVTNKRIDFLVSGYDAENRNQIVLIELKQWSHIKPTPKDGIVVTRYADGEKETTHPSYQVVCYASLIYDYREAVQKREVLLHSCVFLHNYVNDGVLTGSLYEPYVSKARIFCKGDETMLSDFIGKYIKKGDRNKGIYVIENSTIIPSKSLIDCVVKMAEGLPEFKMVDDQKVVYQNVLWAYEQYPRTSKKQVVIIEGGPGTGKSVIAVRLLIEMTRRKLLAHYITKNAAPRNVFYSKFTNEGGANSSIKNLFKSSGIYCNSRKDEFDMLIVDEAHRLQEHSGLYGNMGENQIKEIINAGKVSVFFIDEKQIVSFSDIGSVEAIRHFAAGANAEISQFHLTSQFRCSGSDEYINWLDHLLQYDGKSAIHLSGTTYDFQILDSPEDVMCKIKVFNKDHNKSRMVAGYCWPWASKKDSRVSDIVFPDCGFAHKWNLASDKTWSISKDSVDQIGCIHTCQGLEFEYVGVIIGTDLIYRDGKILVNPSSRAADDFSIHGWKKMMSTDKIKTQELIRKIIKNTYRTLLTRGMKGCYVYVCDNELKEYIRKYSTNNLTQR